MLTTSIVLETRAKCKRMFFVEAGSIDVAGEQVGDRFPPLNQPRAPAGDHDHGRAGKAVVGRGHREMICAADGNGDNTIKPLNPFGGLVPSRSWRENSERTNARLYYA